MKIQTGAFSGPIPGKPSRIYCKLIKRFSCCNAAFSAIRSDLYQILAICQQIVNLSLTFLLLSGNIKKPVQSLFIPAILRVMKKKTIKLNSLQRRTLALFQLLARSPESATLNEATGEITVAYLPEAHGNHVHIGKFTLSAQEASGFANEAVWRALARRDMIISGFPFQATLTRTGLDYDTGYGDKFELSDH